MTSAASLRLAPDPTGSHLLAHQGGWDEILLVVGPLAVVAGLLWVANRRVSAQLQEAEAGEAGADAGEDARERSEGAEGSTGADPRS